MDVPINAEVRCTNDYGGTSTNVIVEPNKDQVTYLVVREKKFPHEERMVPVNHIIESSPSLIRLDFSIDELAKMQVFIERSMRRANCGF